MSPPRVPGWRWWAALLSVTILLRVLVALVALGGMPMVSDANDYFTFAARLAAGDVGGAFYWPVGESAFLASGFALFGPHLLVARLMTIAASTAAVVLTSLLAGELGGQEVGKAAGWVAAAYAPSILLCGQSYSQHLAALCLVALAYFGLRAARAARMGSFLGVGLALGVGCLTRPSMLSVLPVLLAAWALAVRARRSSIGRLSAGAAAAAAVALACVLPVMVHDARAGAGLSLSTNNERNLLLGNNPYTPDYATAHLGQRSLDQLAPAPRAYLESFYVRPDARNAMRRAAVDYAVGHPLRTARRTLNRTLSFWGFDYLASREIQKWFGLSSLSTVPLLALEAGSYCAVAALAILSLVTPKGSGDPRVRAWLLALSLAYEVPYCLAFSGGTYHFPTIPLVTALAALTVAGWRDPHVRRRIASGRSRRAGLVAMCIFAAIQVQYAYYAVVMRG